MRSAIGVSGGLARKSGNQCELGAEVLPDRCPDADQLLTSLHEPLSMRLEGLAPSLLPYLPSLVPSVRPLFAPKKSLGELTRHLALHPNDETSLSGVCTLLRDEGEVEELVELLESLAYAEQGDLRSELAMADLAFRVAERSADDHARELCRTALNIFPAHEGALFLFERLADASWSDELSARYLVFLEDAPLHGVSPDVCELVTNKLVDAERRASMSNEDIDNARQVGRASESTDVLSLHA